jgi:hypothetical protein
MTRDGVIDINDMVMVGQHWLSCWTPSLSVQRPASACDLGAGTQVLDDIPAGFADVTVLIDELQGRTITGFNGYAFFYNSTLQHSSEMHRFGGQPPVPDFLDDNFPAPVGSGFVRTLWLYTVDVATQSGTIECPANGSHAAVLIT